MPKTVNQKLLDASVKHQIALQRLAGGEGDSVVRTLNDFDQSIINAIYKRATVTGSLTDARISQIIRDVRKLNNKAYDAVHSKLTEDLVSFADYEARYQAGVISDALPVDYTIELPKMRVLTELVAEEPIHGAYLNEWVTGMEEGRFTRIRNAIRIGVINGDDVTAIAARLRGTKALNYKDGVFDVSRRSLQTIVRTTANHALNVGKTAVFGANPDLVGKEMLVAVLDDRTTDICIEYNGQVFAVGEAPVPPFHLNCRTNLVPVLPSADDLGLDTLTNNQAAALDGAPPEVPTYEDWLKTQDDATVDDIIGPIRRGLFRKGQLKQKKFKDLVGKKLSLKDLQALDKKEMALASKTTTSKRVVTRRRLKFGWKPDLPDLRDARYTDLHAPETDIVLPVRMSLRSQMPPVFDQGNLGSCTANALVAAVMFVHGPNTPMLSRLDLYWDERKIEDTVKEDAGAEIRNGVKSLAKWGVMPEAAWPYKVRRFRETPPEAGQELAAAYKISSYSRLKGHQDFLQCLAHGYPFVIGFTLYDNWEGPITEDKGILTLPTVNQKMLGGHAVLVVGYDTQFQNNDAFTTSGLQTHEVSDVMYEVRNSFGDGWGDNGYFWVPAAYFEDLNLADDSWTIRK